MTDLHRFPRTTLGFFPTPLTDLPNFSRVLGGPRVLVKRDDLTGLALGGNKVRKLEFLLGQALACGCDTVVTGGAEQSNHCRQTAAAAASLGLECHLVLGGEAPDEMQGNILLDELLGARIHWTGQYRKGEKIPAIVEDLTRAGRKPYVIPYGGSNAIGALGFVQAAQELHAQLTARDLNLTSLVVASSSGGTQAGLVIGGILAGASYPVVGIEIDKGETGDAPFREHVAALTLATAALLEIPAPDPSRLILHGEYVGQGYAVVGDLEREAIRLLARTEGILVDPVYTGRALGGLVDMIRRGEFSSDDTVLFWHTGGTPALFSHSGVLTPART
jgi:D-cysteine desulfhydrase